MVERNFPGGGEDQAAASSQDDTVTMLRAIAQNLSALVEATKANAPVPAAPTNAEYLVGATNATLTAERLVTNTATIAWDLATIGQAKVNLVTGSVANSFLADMVQATVKGRAAGAGTGVPTDLAGTQVAAILPDASTTQRGVVELATDAEIRSASASPANAVLPVSGIASASVAVTLTDAATVAVDWSSGINFDLAITANRVLGNPTNSIPGTWRTVRVAGNDATLRTLTFGSNYYGNLPVLNDMTGTPTFRQYLISIFCVSSVHFVPSAIRAFP